MKDTADYKKSDRNQHGDQECIGERSLGERQVSPSKYSCEEILPQQGNQGGNDAGEYAKEEG